MTVIHAKHLPPILDRDEPSCIEVTGDGDPSTPLCACTDAVHVFRDVTVKREDGVDVEGTLLFCLDCGATDIVERPN